MKRFLCAAALAAVTLTPMIAAAQTPPSYPLVCRGGPTMRIVTAHDVPDGVNTGQNSMRVYFRAAAQANAPGPGECVWVDRTFRPGEPENFYIKGDVEFAFQVLGDGRVNRDGTGWRLNPEGRGAEAAKWRKIVDGVMNGQLFTVRVYNADNRAMIVTAVD